MRQRALALLRGAAVGDALGSGSLGTGTGGVTDLTRWTLRVAEVFATHSRVTEKLLRIALAEPSAGATDGQAFARPKGPSLSELVRVLPVGIVRRPYDYNGIVDDAVSVVAVSSDASSSMAAGCAAAAVLSAILDGWDMEGAASLAMTVARRGATFGRRGREQPEVDESIALALELAESSSPERGRRLAENLGCHNAPGVIGCAIGLAYAHRSAPRAIRDAGACVGHPGVAASLAGAMAAAYAPTSLPDEWIERSGASQLVPDATLDRLLEIRRNR